LVDDLDYSSASPIEYVNPQAPPFLVLNAEKDWGLDRQSRHFVEKLNNAGVKCEWKQYNGSGTNHLSIIGLAKGLGEPYKQMIHDSINFFQELLSNYRHENIIECDPGSVVNEPVLVEPTIQETEAMPEEHIIEEEFCIM
jgi:acetyl esterase/lipase